MRKIFEWLDFHPGSYWLLAGLATLLLVGRIWAALRTELKGGAPARPRLEIGLDGLVMFLFLLAWRWPFFLAANGFNPDEGQLVAGALTLLRDPVFWRSVDGTTSGPLNFYVLLPFAWAGLPMDYFTARLAGLLMVFGGLFFINVTLSRQFGRTVAWLSGLVAVTFFATVTYSDLIHYSSEHLTLFITGVEIWLLAGRVSGDRFRLWLACFLAGAAVWAKLQAAPLSLAFVSWGFWQISQESGLSVSRRWRSAAGMVLAALAPTLLACVMVGATGQMEAAVRRYFIHNLLYEGEGGSLSVALRDMSVLAMKDGRLPLLLTTAGVILSATAIFMFVRRKRFSGLYAAGILITLASIMAILAPRREYLHYVLLLPVPLSFWLGAAIAGCWKEQQSMWARFGLAGIILVVAGLPPIVTRCLQPRPDMVGQFAYHWSHPRTEAAVIVRELAGRKGCLGIWGWTDNLNVESGLPQATRDGHSLWSIQPNPQRDYHRACYLEDLRRNSPSVFVDAVGPGAFSLETRATQAHEIFPELADYIKQNYQLVTDLGDARIYARLGLPSLTSMTPSRLSGLMARGRLSQQERANPIPVSITPLGNFQRKQVDGQEVLMLLPPTQVEWLLEPRMSGVSIGYGFDPVAYEQGASNGAELFLELVNEHGTQKVAKILIDPTHAHEDRGPHVMRIELPRFSPGTRLVIRSAPGQYGDTAWDWVYLANLRFQYGAVSK